MYVCMWILIIAPVRYWKRIYLCTYKSIHSLSCRLASRPPSSTSLPFSLPSTFCSPWPKLKKLTVLSCLLQDDFYCWSSPVVNLSESWTSHRFVGKAYTVMLEIWCTLYLCLFIIAWVLYSLHAPNFIDIDDCAYVWHYIWFWCSRSSHLSLGWSIWTRRMIRRESWTSMGCSSSYRLRCHLALSFQSSMWDFVLYITQCFTIYRQNRTD